jgi:predicted dehydrogenase
MTASHSKQLRGVLIGAGYFAQFHAEAWKRLEGRLPSRPVQNGVSNSAAGMPPLRLSAVADPAPGKAKEFAARHGIPRFYESTETMLDAEKPDFVDIATRPDSHLPLTKLAAQRGIHVICQKPMAPTIADCTAMCDVCDAAGVRLFIHENWRWQPWYREAKRIIDTGALGSLKHVSFDWRTGDGNGTEPYPTQPYFRQMPRLLIYETLVHILDTFRFLAGEMRVTECETRRVNPVIVGEDWAEIRIVFASGEATGFIHGDRQTGPVPAPVAMGSMLIEGDRATLRIAADGQMYLLPGGAASQPPSEPSTELGGREAAPPTTGYKGDSVFAVQQHFLDCLRTGRPSESDGRDYLKTVALVEDCYRLAPKPIPHSS